MSVIGFDIGNENSNKQDSDRLPYNQQDGPPSNQEDVSDAEDNYVGPLSKEQDDSAEPLSDDPHHFDESDTKDDSAGPVSNKQDGLDASFDSDENDAISSMPSKNDDQKGSKDARSKRVNIQGDRWIASPNTRFSPSEIKIRKRKSKKQKKLSLGFDNMSRLPLFDEISRKIGSGLLKDMMYATFKEEVDKKEAWKVVLESRCEELEADIAQCAKLILECEVMQKRPVVGKSLCYLREIQEKKIQELERLKALLVECKGQIRKNWRYCCQAVIS